MATKREVAEKLFDSINAKNWKDAVDCFDEEGSLIFPGTSPLSGKHEGREGIRKYFRRMNIAVPDLHFDIINYAESEKIAVLEWKNSGKTRRNISYENKGVTVLEFKGEKVIELRDYLDTEKLKPREDR